MRDSGLVESSHLEAWIKAHLLELCTLEQVAPDAVAGQTVLHFDLRADNILLTDERVWILDRAGAMRGAAWLDMVLFAPTVHMQGCPTPDVVIQQHPACKETDPQHITKAVASLAGFSPIERRYLHRPDCLIYPRCLQPRERSHVHGSVKEWAGNLLHTAIWQSEDPNSNRFH